MSLSQNASNLLAGLANDAPENQPSPCDTAAMRETYAQEIAELAQAGWELTLDDDAGTIAYRQLNADEQHARIYGTVPAA